MSIARKEISRVFKDGKETIVNDRIDFEFDKEMEEFLSEIFEDYEYAMDHGVFWGRDDDLFLIEVNCCVKELKERINPEDDYEDYHREKKLVKYLKKLKRYTIWI